MNTDQAGSSEQVALPDFRNLGVVLRILVIAELANLLAVVAHAPDGIGGLKRVATSVMPFEVSLLIVVLVLLLVGPGLRRIPYRGGCWAVIATTVILSVGLEVWGKWMLGAGAASEPLKAAVSAGALTALLLGYFNWRQRVLSPALAEARLAALQARIRPHFLFNSLNTAVSLVRQDPRLAEEVLLNMADLFRALLADGRGLVSLGEEIHLATSYLEIEQLRLGERLKVTWCVDDVPKSISVPVMLLQPLVENAVRHGVEVFSTGGYVMIDIRKARGELMIEVRNPLPPEGSSSKGNRMALANISERLSLHFDAEAQVASSARNGEFVAKVRLPLESRRT